MGDIGYQSPPPQHTTPHRTITYWDRTKREIKQSSCLILPSIHVRTVFCISCQYFIHSSCSFPFVVSPSPSFLLYLCYCRMVRPIDLYLINVYIHCFSAAFPSCEWMRGGQSSRDPVTMALRRNTGLLSRTPLSSWLHSNQIPTNQWTKPTAKDLTHKQWYNQSSENSTTTNKLENKSTRSQTTSICTHASYLACRKVLLQIKPWENSN
jgi:hypothetical protein